MNNESITPNPPFPELLGHNSPPDDLQKQVIQLAISTVGIHIADIDDDLEHVAELVSKVKNPNGLNEHIHTVIARLTLVRTKLQYFRERHEGIISCQRRLPPEVLCEIMKWCMPKRASTMMNSENRYSGPTKLSPYGFQVG